MTARRKPVLMPRFSGLAPRSAATSRVGAANRKIDTAPEILLRKALSAEGFPVRGRIYDRRWPSDREDSMTSTFLEYEVVLLLAKYGKPAVLAALATKLELTEGQLMAQLRHPPAKERQHTSKKPRPFDIGSIVASEPPVKAQLLRTLSNRYENRTFPGIARRQTFV